MAISIDRNRGVNPESTTGFGVQPIIVSYAAVTTAKTTITVPRGAISATIQMRSTSGLFTGANDTLDNTGNGNCWTLAAGSPLTNIPCKQCTYLYVHEPSAAAGVGVVEVMFEMSEGAASS